MKWYYAQNNQRQGPISENEFDFLVYQKKILPDTLVWNETMAGWRALREVMPEAAAVPPPVPSIWDAPAPVPPPATPERDGPAWEWRDSIGGLKAAGRTIAQLLVSSDRTFSRMKRRSDWAGPYCFALFVSGVVTYTVLFSNIAAARLGAGAQGADLPATSNYIVGFMAICLYFMLPVAVALNVLFGSAFVHLFLMLVGGARQPFQTTYRVVCYSIGASAVLLLIPGLGLLLETVFCLALMINGIARMHEIPLGKAVLAMAPVIFCAGFFVLRWLGLV